MPIIHCIQTNESILSVEQHRLHPFISNYDVHHLPSFTPNLQVQLTTINNISTLVLPNVHAVHIGVHWPHKYVFYPVLDQCISLKYGCFIKLQIRAFAATRGVISSIYHKKRCFASIHYQNCNDCRFSSHDRCSTYTRTCTDCKHNVC